MTRTLLVVVLFVAAMACLPWLVRRLQQRHVAGGPGAGVASKVLSAVAVGPQQRVVTVEVGPEHARAWLVLGVTPQQIHCLHVLPAAGPVAGTSPAASVSVQQASFAHEMVSAVQATEGRTNG